MGGQNRMRRNISVRRLRFGLTILAFRPAFCRLPGTHPRDAQLDYFRIAYPHKAAAHAIPLSRRSDANLNFRLSPWTDVLRLFVVVYRVSRFVNIILRNEAVLFVTTP
jgi:hypothetical protein